jgi:transposase
MRKIKEILRLKWECGLGDRQISNSCNVGRTTVQEYVSRARAGQLTLEKIRDMSEDVLEELLFPGNNHVSEQRLCPDWNEVHQERKKSGVTLQLLWEEYRGKHPDGYGYSHFCNLYQEHVKTLPVTMRQTHKAGDKLFIDYSGKKGEIVIPETGEIRSAEIFVAVLGASNYTFAEATWTQSLPDWVGSNVRALQFFGGAPALLVPDNLKSGITRACYYDPEINPTYTQFAQHYGTAVLPARARKPRDKAKVEGGVLIVQRWILACLRNQRFFSLEELNAAIAKLLDKYNQRPFKKMPGCRKTVFETLEKPTLRALPTQAYEYAEWKKATVNIDYHVDVQHHYYSVPYQIARQKVDLRITANIVEIFHRGTRVASHVRSFWQGKHSTISEHMPPHHQFVQWSPQRLINWGQKCGGSVVKVIETILDSREHPEQGFRACLGILRFSEKIGNERLNAACARALAFGSPRYKTVVSILERNQDRLPLPEKHEESARPVHANIRGSEYYQLLPVGEKKDA